MPKNKRYILNTIDSLISSVDNFDCGNFQLNSFLKDHQKEAERDGKLRTFCMTTENGDLVGYFSLAMGQAEIEIKTDEGTVEEIKPFVNLAYFAIDRRYHHHHLGRLLLGEFLKICAVLRYFTGVQLIQLESVDDAVGFYQTMGFQLQNEDVTPEKLQAYGNDTSKMSFPMYLTIETAMNKGYLPDYDIFGPRLI